MQDVIVILILLSSFPVGYLLAHLCRDELVAGRKWFKMISLVSFALAFILTFAYFKLEVISTLVYICITSLVSLYKSYDKKFVR
jgi:hypothetical protein